MSTCFFGQLCMLTLWCFCTDCCRNIYNVNSQPCSKIILYSLVIVNNNYFYNVAFLNENNHSVRLQNCYREFFNVDQAIHT